MVVSPLLKQREKIKKSVDHNFYVLVYEAFLQIKKPVFFPKTKSDLKVLLFCKFFLKIFKFLVQCFFVKSNFNKDFTSKDQKLFSALDCTDLHHLKNRCRNQIENVSIASDSLANGIKILRSIFGVR